MVSAFHNLTLLLLLLAPILTMRSGRGGGDNAARSNCCFALPLGDATARVGAKYAALLTLLFAAPRRQRGGRRSPSRSTPSPTRDPSSGAIWVSLLFGAAVLALGLAVSCLLRRAK